MLHYVVNYIISKERMSCYVIRHTPTIGRLITHTVGYNPAVVIYVVYVLRWSPWCDVRAGKHHMNMKILKETYTVLHGTHLNSLYRRFKLDSLPDIITYGKFNMK